MECSQLCDLCELIWEIDAVDIIAKVEDDGRSSVIVIGGEERLYFIELHTKYH